MHHTDQAPHHIPHRITLTNDESIQASPPAERLVETSRLCNTIAAHKRFADHKYFVRVGERGEFLERGHQAGVVVTTTGGVDEDDVEVVGRSIGDGVFGYVRCVFAVPFFVKLHFAQALPLTQFFEIAGVHTELFDGAGAEGVAGGDEKGEIVLEEEES